MKNTLAKIIDEFRLGQDRAVITIRDEFDWKLPTSNLDWVFLCGSEGYHDVREHDRIRINTHGFGVELRYPDLIIDFDWGDQGESTGFDAWRLWSYCELNNRFLHCCDLNLIKAWIAGASDSNELVKKGHLWYRPDEVKIEKRQNKAEEPTPNPPSDQIGS